MLNEDQVIELLAACEARLGHKLDATRRSLKTARNRAAAVWELLVIDAALALGGVEHERAISDDQHSKKVDIYLDLGEQRRVWIEATYLNERSSDNELRSDLLRSQFHMKGQERGIPRQLLWSRLDGDPTAEGFLRRLPAEHELKRFFDDRRIQGFFEAIRAEPRAPVTRDMRPDYTVTLGYDPTGKSWSGGLVAEAPRIVEEHGVYLKLRRKAGQHRDVSGPYVVCVGSDRSPVLQRIGSGGTAGVSVAQAVRAAFDKWPRLSAVILVSIEANTAIFQGLTYSARSVLYVNPTARHPLTSDLQILQGLDFNRWRYSRPYDHWKGSRAEQDSPRHSGGQLMYKQLPNGNVEIQIPAWLVLDALRGSGNVIDAFDLKDNDLVWRVLTSGWEIMAARMVQGNARQADPPSVVLEFGPDSGIFHRK
jgi:hypothetical protein